MSTHCVVRPGEYHDSVALMETARALTQLAGVRDAAVLMGTETNKRILQGAGLWRSEAAAAGANDLIIVVQADSEALTSHALQIAQEHLTRRPAPAEGSGRRLRSLRGAVRANPAANLALVSVAGPYAAGVAWDALHQGLHVLLFSDNVPLADEIALKQYAREHDLLLMGPGCGTAIVDGVALGFANRVPAGPIGIVAAAGTGLQEVSSLLARLGVGISQAIGTGGRDVSEAVGGITMLQGIQALHADPATQALVLIAKAPAAHVTTRILQQVQQPPHSDAGDGRAAGAKPTVVCFLGARPPAEPAARIAWTQTYQEAAYRAAELAAGYQGPPADALLAREAQELRVRAAELRARLSPRQRYARGLFGGGSLAGEALLLWGEMLGDVRSNLTADERLRLPDATHSIGHAIVDLGDDEFTVGRPHPMIDLELRRRRLLQEADDEDVAVILLDVVLGYGAHPDPAGELGPAIRRARRGAVEHGRELIVVASVTGTEEDPQGRSRQVRALEEAGAVVASCNAAAARLAAYIASLLS